jgi:hypothetical protein
MKIVPKPDRRDPNDENRAEIAALIAILDSRSTNYWNRPALRSRN